MNSLENAKVGDKLLMTSRWNKQLLTVEKAAEESSGKRRLAKGSMTAEVYQSGFRDGANYALGKQENDADTVISGWVARDADTQWVYLYSSMPTRGINMWNGHGSLLMPLDVNKFPDLTWDSEPIKVSILIKRE